eukprot:CAMPEP_0172298822 /NCGR_PEP_ID=MMETSP1058-20130122/1299_1 /TAXON_ID=83371 /ORGANISM="Detonula confervacea, Strain CCMP 353" /LENGTH=152 /DNA_ID=CAMNT_0013008115 /DNA_START=131 /DNA_END=589 /DNA_ORIENTATION=-
MASDSPSARDAPSETTSSSAEITEPSSLFSNVPWPVRSSPGINYDIVAMMYLAGSAIWVFFFVLEKQILAPLLLGDEDQNEDNALSESNASMNAEESTDTEEGGDAWKEFAKGMEGMHFIFVLFIPCLLWSLIVRYYWMKETKVASREKKEN